MTTKKEPKPRRFLTHDDMAWQLNPRQVWAIKHGRTHTKPKVFIEEKTGKFFRLVKPESGKSYYVEQPYVPENLYLMKLTPEAKQRYLSEEQKPLDAPYSIATYSYNGKNSEFPAINLGQLHAVTNGLARSYSWVVTEQSSIYSRQESHIVNILFDDKKIIGGRAWSMQDEQAVGSFLMISPDYRGKGLGKYLLDFTVRQNLSMGAKEVPVSTSTNCTNSHDYRVVKCYEAWGWEITKRIKFNYEIFKHGKTKLVSVKYPEDYFLDPKTGEDLPRFRKEHLEQRLTKVSAELFSSVHPIAADRPGTSQFDRPLLKMATD